MPFPTPEGEAPHVLLQVKDEILEVLNQLRQTYQQLHQGTEIPADRIKALLQRGEALAEKIASLKGMEEAGREFLLHIQNIGRAIQDLKNFDALKKAELITGVKF
jgi:cell division FtsZ-interacting protein ZapD